MVVDRSELTLNLTSFYDFRGKSVLYVGAGRGQLLPPSCGVASVFAIDRDADSLQGFRSESTTKWAGIPVRFIPHKFETFEQKGDVVYFEFCMHLMDDPQATLDHARALAPDIVVMDHLPGSKWVYYWAGEEPVLRSTRAVESSGVRRRKDYVAEQRFDDWNALASRLSGEGKESQRRVLELKGTEDIRMRMDYGLFLL